MNAFRRIFLVTELSENHLRSSVRERNKGDDIYCTLFYV